MGGSPDAAEGFVKYLKPFHKIRVFEGLQKWDPQSPAVVLFWTHGSEGKRCPPPAISL